MSVRRRGGRGPRRGVLARGVPLFLVLALVLGPGDGPTHAATPAAVTTATAATPTATTVAFPGADVGSHLLVVTGLGGTEEFREEFHGWAARLVDAARAMGLPESQVTWLAEDPAADPARIDGRADRETVEAELRRLASATAPDDRLLIVLIGHGSAQAGRAGFNLPGPDLTAEDFGALLDLFATQPVALVNAASASGAFIGPLAGPNRTIITATRDARQDNRTVFPRFFVEAFESETADLDKNGRVSLLEAYRHARQEVARFYENDGRLLSETALLEDDGDGEGSAEPDPGTADGAVAGRWFLAPPTAAVGDTDGDDPELQRLLDRKAELEERIEALKLRRDSMDPDAYQEEMEDLLVELARTDRAIRELGEGGGER